MAALLLGASPAGATILLYNFAAPQILTGSPEDEAPGMRLIIDDGGQHGSVTLTFESIGMAENGTVLEWYLNLNPNLNLRSLSISHEDGEEAEVWGRNNSFRIGDAGRFDLQFDFDGYGRRGGSDFGQSNNRSVWVITAPGLRAEDFDFESENRPGSGINRSVARFSGYDDNDQGQGQGQGQGNDHGQGNENGPGQSGMMGGAQLGGGFLSATGGGLIRPVSFLIVEPEATSVPEPATLALFGFGLAGLALGLRRRRTG